MLVPHDLHRTVLPRAISGIESTLRQVRFGHMMRAMVCSDIALPPTLVYIGRSPGSVVSSFVTKRTFETGVCGITRITGPETGDRMGFSGRPRYGCLR